MTQSAHIGLMGKHPAYGDFLSANLSQATASGLVAWLDSCLPQLRADIGPGWDGFWDRAQPLRFWVGRAVLGTTLAGILHPSRDKVGRRYPLLLLSEGPAILPPLIETDQSPWQQLEAHMAQMTAGAGASALLENAHISVPAEDPDLSRQGPTLWAHQSSGSLEDLLAKAAEVDPHRAQLARSYWWAGAEEGRVPLWLGCQGLPDAVSLGWLLAGVAAEESR